MIKITFTLLNLSTGKRTNHSRNIRREEYLDWMDRENQSEIVKGQLVRIVNLQKHVVVERV